MIVKWRNRRKSPRRSYIFRGRSSRWRRRFLRCGTPGARTGLHLRHGRHTNLRFRWQNSEGGVAGVRVGKSRCISGEARLKIFLGGASHTRGLCHHWGSQTEDHLVSTLQSLVFKSHLFLTLGSTLHSGLIFSSPLLRGRVL